MKTLHLSISHIMLNLGMYMQRTPFVYGIILFAISLLPISSLAQNEELLPQEEKIIRALRDKHLKNASDLLAQVAATSLNKKQQPRYDYYQGVLAFEEYRFDKSLVYLENASRALQKSPDGELQARIDFQVGRVYKDGFFNGEMARQYYEKALSYYEEKNEGQETARINFQIARSYPPNELEKRGLYNQKALDFFTGNPDQHKAEIAECFNLEALRIVNEKGLTKNAENLFLRAINLAQQVGIKTSRTLGKYYDNLGFLLYAHKKDTRAGLQFLQKGLQQNRRFSNNEYWIASSFTNLGSVYLEEKLYDSAKHMLQEALNLKLKLYPKNHPEILFSYEHVAAAFSGLRLYDSALHYYDLTVGISSPNASSTFSKSILNNPYLVPFAMAVQMRTELLQERYMQTRNVDLLRNAFQTMAAVDGLLKDTYETFEWENSKISYLKSLGSFYDRFVDLCFQLYELTNETHFAYVALDCMEARRYHSILDTFNKVESLYKVPQRESLSNRELHLKNKLMHQYYLLSIAEQASSIERVNEIQTDINGLTQQYNHFQDSFKIIVARPLDKISIDRSIHSKLAKDQLIVEYKEVSNAIYAIALTDTEISFIKVPKTNALDSTITSLLDALRSPPSVKKFDAEKRKFASNSHRLYETLLQPFEKLISKASYLTIVPDGALYDFPFYVLLPRAQATSAYAKFDYLGKQICISKALSLRLLLQHKKPATFNGASVLAFGSSSEALGLQNVGAELASIKKHFPVKQYTENLCSSATFVREAPNYSILHLALHGKQDSVNHYRSQLLFDAGDTLFAYSLYGLKLNDPLVVLSACESGLGKKHAGEGVFSMARAFSMAGASALFVNMWEVSDKSAADISSAFYEALATSKQPAEALQFASAEFLKNRDDYTSHPYFWASTQIISHGMQETKPGFLFGSTRNMILICLLLLLAMMAYRVYSKYAIRIKAPLG